MASKQKTQLYENAVKIYFNVSRFDDWSEVKHVQLNLFDLETGTNLIPSTGLLEHKRDANGNLLYVDASGNISTNSAGSPYYVSSTALRILFFDQIMEDSEGHYIVLPSEIISGHIGKVLKSQVRLGASGIPADINAAWVTEQLKQGLISEWSSPTVFRVINKPSLTWTNKVASTTAANPTFFVSFSSEEKSYQVKAELNGEVLSERLTSFASVLRFEFKQPLNKGANTFKYTLETEGEYTQSSSDVINYSESGREPTYSFTNYKTEHGGLKLEFSDSERVNQFPYVAPQPPQGMRYDRISGKYYFGGSENSLTLLDPRRTSVSPLFKYVLSYEDDGAQSGKLFVHYDYTDGSSEDKDVVDVYSHTLNNINSIPGPDSLKGVRYSYLGIRFANPGAVYLLPSSIRISSSRDGAVNQYIIKRASAENGYATWETLVEFEPTPINSGSWTYFDNSAHPGTVYKYAVAGRDENGAQSPLGTAMYAASDADYMWVSTKNYTSINFAYDATVSGLRQARREMVVETLGSRYPYLSISGNMNYKTFNLSATLFHEMDSKGEVLKGYYNREGSPGLSVEAIERDILSSFLPGREKNFVLEREFRDALIQELTDTNPVLFKFDTDKPMIVAFSMINASPRRELGNVIFNFSATVTEVAECTIENLKKFNLLNQEVLNKE